MLIGVGDDRGREEGIGDAGGCKTGGGGGGCG